MNIRLSVSRYALTNSGWLKKFLAANFKFSLLRAELLKASRWWEQLARTVFRHFNVFQQNDFYSLLNSFYCQSENRTNNIKTRVSDNIDLVKHSSVDEMYLLKKLILWRNWSFEEIYPVKKFIRWRNSSVEEMYPVKKFIRWRHCSGEENSSVEEIHPVETFIRWRNSSGRDNPCFEKQCNNILRELIAFFIFSEE